MNPYKYTTYGSRVVYHYKYSDLKRFLTEGKKYGSVGLIITERNDKQVTYRGFGTIENPYKWLSTIEYLGFDLVNDEDIINPPENKALTSYSIMILDVTK